MVIDGIRMWSLSLEPQESRDFDEIEFVHGVRAEDKIYEMQRHYERLLGESATRV